METGLTVGTLMDQMKTLDPDAPVVTDTGEVIFTVAPEQDATCTRNHLAAMTHHAEHADPITVDEVRAMFAYYNVTTPRSRKANAPCRDSLVLLRPMGDTARHIAAIGHDDGSVILHTEPLDEPGTTPQPH